MSSTTPDDTDSQFDEQAILSHLVRRLLQREGGQIPLERVTPRVCDYVDIGEQAAADLIDEDADACIYRRYKPSASRLDPRVKPTVADQPPGCLSRPTGPRYQN
jgi:hypothetical protein